MVDDRNFRVDDVNPIISIDDDLKRLPPRDPALQEDDYLEKFDTDTIFYDTYRLDDTVICTGPPLLNMESSVVEALSAATGPSTDVRVNALDRVSHLVIAGVPSRQEQVSVAIGGTSYDVAIGNSQLDSFRGKTVLVTKSKNNNLRWIRDWAHFYATNHGVNAVLIYDNASTAYQLDEVLEAISVEGIDSAVVVNWPFKFGPQGGRWNGPVDRPWDSDFCEYGITEHARRKYLRDSAYIISHDIDELLIVEGDSTVQELIDSTEEDYLSYDGVWIEAARDASEETPRFSDFCYTIAKGGPTTRKWTASAARLADAAQWKTHSVAGASSAKTPLLKHRHFKGITTNWKWKRSREDEKIHQGLIVDRTLKRVLDATFAIPNHSSFIGDVLDSPSPESKRAYLENLADEVFTARWTADGLKKSWFWKDDVYVMDFEVRDVGAIAFELRLQAAKLSLVVTARDSVLRERLRESAELLGTRFGKSGYHLEVNWWELHIDPIDIAKDCISGIERTMRSLPDITGPSAVQSNSEPTSGSLLSKAKSLLRR